MFRRSGDKKTVDALDLILGQALLPIPEDVTPSKLGSFLEGQSSARTGMSLKPAELMSVVPTTEQVIVRPQNRSLRRDADTREY